MERYEFMVRRFKRPKIECKFVFTTERIKQFKRKKIELECLFICIKAMIFFKTNRTLPFRKVEIAVNIKSINTYKMNDFEAQQT